MRRCAALLLALLAPTASACSYAAPAPLERISQPAQGALVGSTDLFWAGVVDLAEGTVRSEFPTPSVVSPDGRWVAFARAGPDVQAGPTRVVDTCGTHLSRHLLALDRETGRLVMVDAGPVWAMGAVDEGVATFDAREMRVYRWGSWELARTVDARGIVEAHAWRDRIPLSPEGAHAIAWKRDSLHLFSLPERSSRALDADGASAFAWTFSPDGRHLALVFANAAGTELRVLRASDLTVVARDALETPSAEPAGAPGELALRIARPHHEEARVVVRSYADAERLAGAVERGIAGSGPEGAAWDLRGGLAWDPRGGTLAVSTAIDDDEARVVVLDARLRELRDVTVRLLPSDTAAWQERAAQQVPVPEYSALERARVPALPVALLVLAAALALAALSRRG